MNRKELIDALARRRDALGLTGIQIAERAGLTDRSIRNALGPQGNPQLSSLLALVDALDMELELVPKGFGTPGSPADGSYRPVSTRIGDALAQASEPAQADAPVLQAGAGPRRRSP